MNTAQLVIVPILAPLEPLLKTSKMRNCVEMSRVLPVDLVGGGDDIINLVAGVAEQGRCLCQCVVLVLDCGCVSRTPDQKNC